MKRLEFHIAYICSHKCIFCSEYDRMNKFKRYPISIKEVKIILLDRRKKGFNHVNFTGGEPTLFPGFLNLLKFTNKLGYKIYVGTNGVMFSSKEFAKEAFYYINELSLSVHWYNKNTCNFQIKNSHHYDNFKGIIKNINVFNNKTELFLNIVINKYNYKNIIKIIQFNINIGYKFNQVLISYVAPEGIAFKDYVDLSFNYNNLNNLIPKIIKLGNNLNKKIRFFGIPICILGDKNANYSNDLHWEERYTIERKLYKNKKVGLIEIYSPDNSRERSFINKCDNCKWKLKPCTGFFNEYKDLYEV